MESWPRVGAGRGMYALGTDHVPLNHSAQVIESQS